MLEHVVKTTAVCRICSNSSGNEFYEVKEMMFGIGDKFKYFKCSECGCLQILEIPEEIHKYYPSNYCSFTDPQSTKGLLHGFKQYLKNLRNKAIVSKRGFLGRLLQRVFPNQVMELIARSGVNKDSRILDVGCGSGKLLLELRSIGFTNLLGVDPYIEKTIDYGNGLQIAKCSIIKLEEGNWDLIMFHHSLEHIPNPEDTLVKVSQLLSPEGKCLVRIPVVDSYAWKNYGVNWVQLDAPRHLFLHSRRSLDILAKKAGLKIYEVVFDSWEFQFWGSEQYVRGIPLCSSRSYSVSRKNSIFSRRDIRYFRQKAKELNETRQGDQAAFFLKKI
ncbi:class I SAM-dependent methyltransferase [Calderihabitans maritimus]|uniref:class I SAM-dependent methyltransferase n=1 Tax=Calderihabitans maritimus TaxID=1246530 RepID=UPI00192CEFC6|nr:class I SAM-dependent methyltransferase [Calderihabitans maritimus]